MQFGSHRHLIMDLDKSKIAFIAVTVIAISTTITASMLLMKNLALDKALESEQKQVTKLSMDLKASTDALDNFRRESQAQRAANDQASEQQVGAFAKQAAKCVPIMQKFGVQ